MPQAGKSLFEIANAFGRYPQKWDSRDDNRMENIWNAVKARANKLVRAILLSKRTRGETTCHSFHQKPLKKPVR